MPLPDVFTAQTGRFAITAAVEARLRAVPGLTVYVGEVPGDVTVQPNSGGRVEPYAVIFPSAGRPNVTANLEASLEGGGDFLWTGQITFTAGYVADLMDTLDQAIPLLHLWSPDVPGLSCGLMRPPIGFDSGPARRNDTALPPRHSTPTLWQLHVTSTPA